MGQYPHSHEAKLKDVFRTLPFRACAVYIMGGDEALHPEHLDGPVPTLSRAYRRRSQSFIEMGPAEDGLKAT